MDSIGNVEVIPSANDIFIQTINNQK